MEGFPLGLNREKVQSGDDKLMWVGARDGIFSIKRLYDCLELRRLVDFPSKVIWKSWAPSKVTFFFLGRLLGVEYYCREEETCDDILLHYEKTKAVWHFLLSIFGAVWVFPLTIKELLFSWHNPCKRREKKSVANCSLMPFLNDLERKE